MRIIACNDDKATVANIKHEKRLVNTRVDEFKHSTLHGELRRGKFLGSSYGDTAINGFGLKSHYTDNQYRDT